MTKLIKGQDGSRYAIMTTEEVKKQKMAVEPMQFKTQEEAMEMLQMLAQTPEGREEIDRLMKQLQAH
ncbi:hypothetical protein MNBD_GAMMA10-1626 [hydrothermal vent metagenome]|uniref:Uncharacterized protein n=1 Tax=hydrothermal vent metagenome TaxID=652676 RepID=A0A3B0YB47_9ZZZZ